MWNGLTRPRQLRKLEREGSEEDHFLGTEGEENPSRFEIPDSSVPRFSLSFFRSGPTFGFVPKTVPCRSIMFLAVIQGPNQGRMEYRGGTHLRGKLLRQASLLLSTRMGRSG